MLPLERDLRSESTPLPIVWFHAASVGELESLIPVVECFGPNEVALVLTVFSESASGTLERLVTETRARGVSVLLTGASPWEGDWEEFFQKLKPSIFVTSKYEAWPDLWASLAHTNTPLVITGAQARSSFRWVKRSGFFLGFDLPRLIFLPVRKKDEPGLRALFPAAQVEAVGDPRWDRAFQRASRGSPRARSLIERAKGMPRPWFILGSVWEGDFGVLKPLLHSGVAGTLWVVPHRVDSLETLKIEACLVSSGLKSWVRSLEWERWGKEGRVTDGRWAAAEPAQAILVNEIGILSELYACADWAYVGGGFGAGVHSTIEPAMYGVPVATGPSQSERFPESELLRSTQQLRVVRTAEDLIDWWKFAGMAAPKFRERWLLQGREQLGAARRIAEMIRRASGLSLETRD